MKTTTLRIFASNLLTLVAQYCDLAPSNLISNAEILRSFGGPSTIMGVFDRAVAMTPTGDDKSEQRRLLLADVRDLLVSIPAWGELAPAKHDTAMELLERVSLLSMPDHATFPATPGLQAAGCCTDDDINAYREHSVMLHQVDAVLRQATGPLPTEPYPTDDEEDSHDSYITTLERAKILVEWMKSAESVLADARAAKRSIERYVETAFVYYGIGMAGTLANVIRSLGTAGIHDVRVITMATDASYEPTGLHNTVSIFVHLSDTGTILVYEDGTTTELDTWIAGVIGVAKHV